MSSISYTHDEGDDFVTRVIETHAQTAKVHGDISYRQFRISVSDGEISNDGKNTETVTVEVVDGLEVARGTDTADATVLDVNDDAILAVDGSEQTVTISAGTGSVDLTTTKEAGSTIKIEAVELSSHPADRDSATIEVVN